MLGNKKAFKILVTGSFGSGKTTLIKTLSEIDPLTTEKKISSPSEQIDGKKTTTVAMDMGKLKIGEDIEIHLFATPGQDRFDFMLDILKKGILGGIVLVDAANPKSVEIAERFAEKIRTSSDIPLIFCVTKTDVPGAKSLDEIKAHLGNFDDIPIEVLDPRDKDKGKEVLIKLLSMILS